MKKVAFAVMVALAIGAASCGNKQQQAPEGEQTEQTVDVDGLVNQLKEVLADGDASQLQQALEGVKAKVAELVAQNPEVAKQYVEKVQTFLNDNAEKIKAVVGDNAVVSTVVSSLTETSPEAVVNSLVGQLNQAGDDAKKAGQQAIDDAKAAGQQAIDDAKAAGQQAIDDAKADAQKKVDDAKADAQKKVDDAVNQAADDAKKAVGNLLR